MKRMWAKLQGDARRGVKKCCEVAVTPAEANGKYTYR
jgi:hypothetical protein